MSFFRYDPSFVIDLVLNGIEFLYLSCGKLVVFSPSPLLLFSWTKVAFWELGWPRNTLNIVKGNGLLDWLVVSSLTVINKMVSKRVRGNNSVTPTTSKLFPTVSSMKTKKPIVLHEFYIVHCLKDLKMQPFEANILKIVWGACPQTSLLCKGWRLWPSYLYQLLQPSSLPLMDSLTGLLLLSLFNYQWF